MATKIQMRRGLKANLPTLDPGEYGVTTDSNEVYVGSSNGNILLSTPSGAMMDYAGTTAPSGWLMCDGAAISRTTYANLFAAIGTSYGVGDGSSTFNLPDFRGRFARYIDNMGTATGAAGRDSGRVHGTAQTQGTARNGQSISISSSVSDPGHNHTVPRSDATNATVLASNVQTLNTSSGSINTSGATTGISVSSSVSSWTSTDSETRPINLVCYKIIKS